MSSVRADYDTRIMEIRSYIALLKLQDELMMASDTNIEGYKAMKAATHLLIYNLVESTATGIHEHVFDAVTSSGTSFDELIVPLRKTVLRNAQKPNADKLVLELRNLSLDLMNATFDRENIFAGNVDAKKLRDSFRSLGLDEPRAVGRRAKDGSDSLLKIKGNRNDLAHGRKTFAEIGRHLTPNDLETELDCVAAFLDQCVTIAEEFVRAAKFREDNAAR